MTAWCLKRGVLAALITFALLLYWYAIANRYTIFLYGHVDHVGDPPAQAFDALTRTRYVMASFAAAGYGAVVEVALAMWIRSKGKGSGWAVSEWAGSGRVGSEWATSWPRSDVATDSPSWRHYVPTALCLATAVILLVGSVNFPTLPLNLALAVGAAAAAGFLLAMACRDAVDGQWRALLWLAADGAGPAMVVLGWRVIELPERGSITPLMARVAAAGVLIAAVGWSAVMTWVRHRPAWSGVTPRCSVARMLAAGAWVTLLGFPVLHHLHTPLDYRYITAAQNVGGYHVRTWAGAMALAAIIAVAQTDGAARLAERAHRWRAWRVGAKLRIYDDAVDGASGERPLIRLGVDSESSRPAQAPPASRRR